MSVPAFAAPRKIDSLSVLPIFNLKTRFSSKIFVNPRSDYCRAVAAIPAFVKVLASSSTGADVSLSVV